VGRPIFEKALTGWLHSFRILLSLIHIAIQFFCFLDGVKTAINVCILMVMVSPCFINVWITANCNGLKMKMKYTIFHNRRFAGSLKGYLFSSQKPFNHRQKVYSKFVIFIFIPLIEMVIIGGANTNGKW
jgi:hypothetical protein